MTELNKTGGMDFSKFDNMSSAELEEILEADFYASDDEESSVDMILYILEVLEKRGENAKPKKSAEEAWEEFKRDYLPYADTLLDDEPCEEKKAEKKSTTIGKPESKVVHLGRATLRWVSTIAASFVLLMALGISASAMGFNVFDKIAAWTAGTFGFAISEEKQDIKTIPSELNEFVELLDKNGLDSQALLPGYLPEGYEISTTHNNVIESACIYNCCLVNGNSYITFLYTEHLNALNDNQVQKDDGNPETYKLNEMTFYIMTNYGTYRVSWLDNNIECEIYGFETREELIKTINSIYGE